MHASSKTYNDVKKYFQGTYIVVPEYDPNKVLLVESVSPTGVYVSEENGDKGLISLEDGGYILNSPLPLRRQWFQAEAEGSGRAYLLTRIPARMWKKGIHSENTTFLYHRVDGQVTNAGWSGPRLYDFFANKNKFATSIPPVGSSIKESLALSDLWCFHTKTSQLFLYDAPVGALSDNRNRGYILKEFSNIPLPSSLKGCEIKYV